LLPVSPSVGGPLSDGLPPLSDGRPLSEDRGWDRALLRAERWEALPADRAEATGVHEPVPTSEERRGAAVGVGGANAASAFRAHALAASASLPPSSVVDVARRSGEDARPEAGLPRLEPGDAARRAEPGAEGGRRVADGDAPRRVAAGDAPRRALPGSPLDLMLPRRSDRHEACASTARAALAAAASAMAQRFAMFVYTVCR